MNKEYKCFISAPAGTNTSILKDILRHLGVRAYDLYDFAAGESVADITRYKIKEADFVVVVISNQSPNVFYELGLCEGFGKPVFIIIDTDVNAPYFIQDHLHLKTKLDNPDLLKISLSNFVQEYTKNKAKLKKRTYKQRTKTKTNYPHTFGRYLDTVGRLREQGSEEDVERMAQEILSALSLQYASSQPDRGDKGIDFAVWSDSLSSAIGNPILIEIKSGELDPLQIRSAESQLQHYLANSEAKAGILLYLDKRGKRFSQNFSLTPLILRYDFEDFIRELSRHSFEDVILSARNKIVHGEAG